MTHIHTRDLDGISSEQIEDWEGTPLVGSYLLKSTLTNPNIHNNYGPPIILIPGGWDPIEGEFSADLVRTLLEKEATSAVYELHFCYEGQDGYDNPDMVLKDLIVMSQGKERPVFISLCAGAVLCMEAMMRIVEINPAPAVSGILAIGPGLSYLNRVGKALIYGMTNKKVSGLSKHLVYSGHNHTIGNSKRHYDFWFTTQLRPALDEVDPTEPLKGGYPVTVEALYFQYDLVSREGRARARRVFQMEHRNDHLKGMHGALRKYKAADTKIIEFYNRMAQQEATRLQSQTQDNTQNGVQATPETVHTIKSS